MTQHEGAIKAVQAGYWNLDGVLAQTAWDFTVKQLRESGELSKDPPYADYVLADLSRRGRGAGAHLHSVTSPPRRTAVALERRRSMLTDRSNDTLITRRPRS